MSKVNCVICGKPLPTTARSGEPRKNGKYCSMECLREGRRRYAKVWYENNMRNESWRKERNDERRNEYHKTKAKIVSSHAKHLATMDNAEEIEAYVNRYFSLKRKYL